MSDPQRPPLAALSQIDPKILEKYAADGKILSHRHPDPTIGISIHNYSDSTAFRGRWDPVTLACRTLVTETKTGKVVARGFPKFFGVHEEEAYHPTGKEEVVVIEEKLDGSISLLFWYQGSWIWTSKGRFDSAHAAFAKEIMGEKYAHAYPRLDKDKTYVFEIIHPKNVIGVRYAGRKELVLLAMFRKDGSEVRLEAPGGPWETLPFGKPNIFTMETSDWAGMRDLPLINSEGFVVRFHQTANDERPERLKIKLKRYLEFLKKRENVNDVQDILKYYISCRTTISSFDREVVSRRMGEFKEHYFKTARSIADDLGGEKWVSGVQSAWNRIEIQFVGIMRRWEELLEEVREEGYADREWSRKRQFANMVLRKYIAEDYKQALFGWYDGKDEIVLKNLCKLASL
ncbi:hypothetical protein L873DRAFT_894069 [Choiromyces venosus 120613-1]|uniref:T4 RNA ligase 1-like N-terminal domain-containing protein n=1 Tax=Choiromyces venosus 120613-1 TaxID=1336337 RepID=A0A3N4JMV4_9PEZI|nr:hypothetical protein L873DRAFT_894069 [Choiromyces venosus 120613-1]